MKKYLFIILSLFLFSDFAFSQSEKYAVSINASDLKKHLRILASDEYEGRETGKAGQKKAAAYLRKEFKLMGLTPVNDTNFYQTYHLYERVLGKRELTINSISYNIGEEFNVSKDKLLIEEQNHEIYFVGYGIKDEKYNSFADLDVSGKVIVAVLGEPMIDGKYIVTGTDKQSIWSNRNKKIAELRKLNPSLIILIDPSYDKFAKYYKHQLETSGLSLAYQYKEATTASVITINKAVARGLLKPNKKDIDKVLTSLNKKAVPSKPFRVNSTIKARIEFILQDVYAENVLAMIPGTDKKDEYIFVTAHYDHIGSSDGEVYNGADDDGSGTVALLEMAQAFMQAKQEGQGPRRSIIFMAVSGEEKGLLGSEYYTDHAIVPLSNTVCDLNIDMIGRIDKAHEADSNYVYVIGADKLSSELHTINEEANKKVKLNLDYTYNDPKDPNRFYYRSDHYNFAKNNIPIIFYFNGVHDDYHKEGDEWQKISFGMLCKRSQLVFHTAWDLANRENRIVVDKANDFPTER